MHVVLTLSTLVLSLVVALPSLRAQESAAAERARTFKAILFLVPNADAGSLRVENLKEIWSEGESAAKLQARLKSVAPEQLQVLEIAPGEENPVVQYKDLTFRISGLYRGPQKDRMYLRVSFDQGGQAAVKEFLANLDESVLVAYPLTGDPKGSLVALLIPTG
jgi:hypothetical protein